MKRHAYIVKWRDSQSFSGWRDLDSRHGVAEISCIGWLVREDKGSITISAHFADNGDTHSPMTIPREAITKMKKLRYYIEGK